MCIDLPVQYMKTPPSEHVVYKNCSESQNINKKQFVYTACSEGGVFMYWTGKSMNNILSYCGLVDAKINTSDKDLPVFSQKWSVWTFFISDELVHEKEKFKAISDELDQTFAEMSGY